MTDVEKAVFVAVYARFFNETGNAHRLACDAVADLRTAQVPDTEIVHRTIMNDVRGIRNDVRCPACKKTVIEPHYNWGAAYCSKACLARGSR